MATTERPPPTPEPRPDDPPRWGRRLAWLLGLWLASVATLGTVAWLLGWIMRAVGLNR